MYDIIEFCPVPPPYGGATVFVKRLSEQLSADGYVVGGYYTSQCKEQKILDSNLYYLSNICHSKNLCVRALSHAVRLLKNIREIEPFKIVHYHGLENLKLIWFLYKYRNKKIVITVHSSMIESFYRRTTKINKYYMRKLAESDVHWIAVSQQTKECMLRLPFEFRNEILVIAAYVPIKNISQPLSKDMHNYLLSHNKNIAFYARSFMLNDGVDVYGFIPTLEMYAELIKCLGEKIGLVFCLSEDKDKDKIFDLHKKAKLLGIDDKIFWQVGAIDNINSLWEKIDVYVRPTSTDGDSVAVREVLDLGVQVVASNVCLRPEGTILYDYGNNLDFVRKVMQSLTIGKQQACLNFDFYNKMLGVFNSILER